MTELTDVEPLRVHLSGSDLPLTAPQRRRCRRGASLRTFVLTSNDPVQQILPQNTNRVEAYVQAVDVVATTAAVTGSATSPGAGGTVAQLTAAQLPAGLYSVTVTGYLGGTPSATTDRNNMGLYAGSTLLFTLPINGQASGASFQMATPGAPLRVELDGATALTVEAIGAATAGAIYTATITATSAAGDVTLHTSLADAQAVSNAGITVPSANTAPYPLHTTDAVWATAADLPVILSVASIIETYE